MFGGTFPSLPSKMPAIGRAEGSPVWLQPEQGQFSPDRGGLGPLRPQGKGGAQAARRNVRTLTPLLDVPQARVSGHTPPLEPADDYFDQFLGETTKVEPAGMSKRRREKMRDRRAGGTSPLRQASGGATPAAGSLARLRNPASSPLEARDGLGRLESAGGDEATQNKLIAEILEQDHVEPHAAMKELSSWDAETGAAVVWPKREDGQYNKSHRERKRILKQAMRLGRTRTALNAPPRHILVIYNPVSGGGASKRLVDHMVAPIFKLAMCDFTAIKTEYQGFAIQYMRGVEPAAIDGILIAGGDGLVHEVITGYFSHPNLEAMRTVPVGIVPSGTANAMAREIHTHRNTSHVSIVGRAALAVAQGETKLVDVIKVEHPTTDKHDIYALSVFGWGLSGSVAKKADEIRKSSARYIPGNKRFRYDIAGFFQVLSGWPQIERGLLEYPVHNPTLKRQPDSQAADDEQQPKPPPRWVSHKLSCVNFVATNLKELGKGHPMHPEVEVDDGRIALVWAADNCTRANLVGFSRQMKKGGYLKNCRKNSSLLVTEFKLTPHQAKAPFLIDGDPHEAEPVHVKILQKALRIFWIPRAHGGYPSDDESTMSMSSTSSSLSTSTIGSRRGKMRRKKGSRIGRSRSAELDDHPDAGRMAVQRMIKSLETMPRSGSPAGGSREQVPSSFPVSKSSKPGAIPDGIRVTTRPGASGSSR